ncbi:MAG: chorismate lyase, partial [Propionivibrio sp.]
EAMGAFEVRVLRQQLARPTSDEATAMHLSRKRLVWVREVVLLCDEVPVVFAHSVLSTRPRGPMTRWFRCLGNRSLGALLFAHAGFRRSAIRFRPIDCRHPLFAIAVENMRLQATPPPRLWARRSGFSFGWQSVLVTEIFNPCLYSH